MRNRTSEGAAAGLWALLAALAVLLARFWLAGARGILDPAVSYGLPTVVFALALTGLVVVHGRERLGAWRLAAVLAANYVVALSVETLGVLGGWVFGRYSYSPVFPGRLFGLVPAVVPWLWCGLVYLAFATTEAILGRRRAAERMPWLALALRSALSAALLLIYDLVADPNHVVRGGWSFAEPGFYFGVPAHNFLGWLALGFVLALPLHRLAMTSSRAVATGSRDLVLALAYLIVLAHESLLAVRISGLAVPAVVGCLAIAAVVALLARPARRGVAAAWRSLRPAEAARGTVFALAGFLIGQPSPFAPDFDHTGFVLCALGGFGGAAAVLAHNSYEGRRYDRHNPRHRNHPLLEARLTAGQQLGVSLLLAVFALACFAAYRPFSALAALATLTAGALYSAERLRAKETPGVPTLLHLSGAFFYFWAGAGSQVSSPAAVAAAAALALLFVAGHFQHVALDRDADGAAGLRTLAVRRGVGFSVACSSAMFLTFYGLVACAGARGWWPWAMAAPFLIGAALQIGIFAATRPWSWGDAARRYTTLYRVVFLLAGAVALIGWWSRGP